MNLYYSNINSIVWYLKYVGLPLTLCFSIHCLISRVSNKKRRSALQKKVVVITGASSGIGEALAHSFYAQGSTVVLAARRRTELDRVKKELMSRKMPIQVPEPVVLELDLSNLDSMDSFVKKIYDSCGHIDILINNGGVSHRASILNTEIKVYKQIMDVNYFGSVALTKAALPKMVERKSGHIVFISSVQGLIAIPNRSAYAASKHAIQAFGDSLRAEMHQHNINVTVISPGYVKTAVSLNALTGSGSFHGVMDSETAAGFTSEYAAEKFLDMIVNKENERVLSQLMPHIAIYLRQCFPSLYFQIMAKRATSKTN
ncbi:dehydrogenase/reductase SDR family protein 7-like [Galleria mellonella]|uniref:Dehydrogenase/reductase SDR family protein 7-like n=1 Tax=Galleria mellonella TaxID=7137 RepID=A0A6J1WXH6_GALME|nr:dehydrogenase/reductase SDR family protein 7-like [Galleria mellonella]